jgi:UDP-N-acetylmuramate--alanine ligase
MSAAGAPRAAWAGRRLHILGVGGAGMSAYARAAHALGAQLSGSDAADSPYLERLRADGVLDAAIGHDAANVPAGRDVEVFYSSAIPAENPERAAARARGLRERPRAELLGELSALKRTIAVAGTHGKTTTAAMLVHALRGARGGGREGRGEGAGAADGRGVSWLVGGPVGGGLANANWEDGELLVVEADESDRSLLSLDVAIAVLTNVELDHHATFGSLAELRAVFAEFLVRAREGVVIWDRPELRALAASAVAAGVAVVPYDVPAPALHAGGSTFGWRGHEVRLAVPGAHNALNGAAALEAACLAGADAEAAIAALAGFRGAGRRFQPLGQSARGAELYEDYAHHPTEVAATLRAARTLPHRRLVAVFQPHLFSRTQRLARELGEALALADLVVVLDVYPARERAADFPGVSGLLIAEACADAAGGRAVCWLPTFAAAEGALAALLGAGDLCLVMGAGDVDALGRRLTAGAGGESGAGAQSAAGAAEGAAR